MASKNELEKAALKEKAAKQPQKPEEVPVDCQFMESELEFLYRMLDNHAATKDGRPLQDKMNLAVINHRKKFESVENNG